MFSLYLYSPRSTKASSESRKAAAFLVVLQSCEYDNEISETKNIVKFLFAPSQPS